MYCEDELIAKRSELQRLLFEEKLTRTQTLSERLGMSIEWVKKWKQYLFKTREMHQHGDNHLKSASRRPKQIATIITPELQAKVLKLRHELTQEYHRKVGCRTITYFLKKEGVVCSASTVHKILKQTGCISTPTDEVHYPFERPGPMQVWEIDFCDVASMPTSDKKHQHGTEVLAVIDRGTSICVDLQTSQEYDAEYTLMATAQTLLVHGCPFAIVCDRDPRLVGSHLAQGMPSAWMRFLLCLGITPEILPPRRPQLKPFVERFILTLKTEFLTPKAPKSLPELVELLPQEQLRYNLKRPHQSKICGNLPPTVAFSKLPPLPRIPEQIDPDAWLTAWDKRRFTRRVDPSGRVKIAKYSYYVGKTLAGRKIGLSVDAKQKTFQINANGKPLKTLAIKGLYGGVLMDFQTFLGAMIDHARSEWKEYLWRQRLKRVRPKQD
jgi:transposase InsO family protein